MQKKKVASQRSVRPPESSDDSDGIQLLSELVGLAPTNLEDPLTQRYEKPRYAVTAERIRAAAQAWGLSARVYDPLAEGADVGDLHGIPRPNVIVDLPAGSDETVLLLAHYDVVPVPAEQLDRWKSPPHRMTRRENGRLYGRGSNDDLGSGVVASLLAMRRLSRIKKRPRNVRLLVCCDEETGGDGGIEAIKERDTRLPKGDPDRILVAHSALIPDGSPHTSAACSGLVFLDAGFRSPVALPTALDFGEALVGLHDTARRWRSRYPSPDWPDHGAPDRFLTGRATVTKFDLGASWPKGETPGLVAAHAESDAANQIAETVTLLFAGPDQKLATLPRSLERFVHAPFRLTPAQATSLAVPVDALAIQVVGQGAHGGYPHLGHNPVPATLQLLRDALSARLLLPDSMVTATFSVDLRLIPEAELDTSVKEIMGVWRQISQRFPSDGFLEAPPSRRRAGYALPVDHPVARRLERILSPLTGEAGIFGDYGGTDASALRDVKTPDGKPMPAVVFGSMDRDSGIHQAEESVDPALLRAVAQTIERFVLGA